MRAQDHGFVPKNFGNREQAFPPAAAPTLHTAAHINDGFGSLAEPRRSGSGKKTPGRRSTKAQLASLRQLLCKLLEEIRSGRRPYDAKALAIELGVSQPALSKLVAKEIGRGGLKFVRKQAKAWAALGRPRPIVARGRDGKAISEGYLVDWESIDERLDREATERLG